MKRFGCGFILFPLLMLLFGLVAALVGRSAGPGANATARAFSDDPSCSIEMPMNVRGGACETVAATIEGADFKMGGLAKSPIKTPYALVSFADGTTANVRLDGGNGDNFVYSVHPGSPGRVQRFHGAIVRMRFGSETAQSADAPDVDAETFGEMRVVGPIAIVLALAIVIARLLALRRP